MSLIYILNFKIHNLSTHPGCHGPFSHRFLGIPKQDLDHQKHTVAEVFLLN